MSGEGKKSIFKAARIPFLLLVIMWGVHAINLIYNLDLFQYGIEPRKATGLLGIIFSPFIHSTRDYAHIINNSVPTFILGWSLFYFYRKIAWGVLFTSWFVGGIFVWIAARDSFHAGMSGVIYSLAFFLFFSGVFRKDNRLMAISMFVVFLYGSMIWGVLPLDSSISFESHALGAVVGIVLAFFLQHEGATFKKKVYQWEIDEAREKEMEKQGFTSITDTESGYIIHYEYKPKEKKKLK